MGRCRTRRSSSGGGVAVDTDVRRWSEDGVRVSGIIIHLHLNVVFIIINRVMRKTMRSRRVRVNEWMKIIRTRVDGVIIAVVVQERTALTVIVGNYTVIITAHRCNRFGIK